MGVCRSQETRRWRSGFVDYKKHLTILSPRHSITDVHRTPLAPVRTIPMSRRMLSVLVCSLTFVFLIEVSDGAAPLLPEQQIRQALNERTQMAFTDTPLTDALDFLEDVHKVTMILDVAALQDEGVDPGTPINLEISGVTLRSALNLALKPLHLTYLVEDEVLKITTLQKANETLVTRVYPVRDLADDVEELESIIEAVQAGCDQAGWATTSNKSISGVKKSRALVIRQTHVVHEEIEALLQDLREANKDSKPASPTPISNDDGFRSRSR